MLEDILDQLIGHGWSKPSSSLSFPQPPTKDDISAKEWLLLSSALDCRVKLQILKQFYICDISHAHRLLEKGDMHVLSFAFVRGKGLRALSTSLPQ